MNASHSEHAPGGFWTHLRRRIIVVSTMERDVRLTFAVGSAIIPLAIVLSLLGPMQGPFVETIVGRIPAFVETIVGRIPVITLLALALGEVVVFLLLFAGLVRLRGRPRYAAQGGVLLALALFLFINDFQLPAFAIAIPLAILWISPSFIQRQRWAFSHLGNSAFVAALLTVGLLVIYAATGDGVLVVSFVAFQGLLAMLGLFMTSTDIAEIVSLAAEAGVSTITRTFTFRWLMVPLAIATIVLNAMVSFSNSGWSPHEIATALGSGLALALWLGLLYLLILTAGRRLGPVEPHLSYGALFLIVITYFVVLQLGLGWRELSDPRTYDPGQLFTYPEVFTLAFLVFLLGIVLLLTLGGRSPAAYVSLSYVVCVGLFWFFYFASHGANLVYFEDAVVMGSVIILVVSSRLKSIRPRFESICALIADVNLCFAGYAIIAALFFATKGHSPGLSVWQAIIVLLALGWDVLSSGEAITNRHSESFPRSSRVCFFLAYVVMVALLVMVSSASKLVDPVTSRAVVFEAEPRVATGLLLFGPPFFFLIFTLRMRSVVGAVSGGLGTSQPA